MLLEPPSALAVSRRAMVKVRMKESSSSESSVFVALGASLSELESASPLRAKMLSRLSLESMFASSSSSSSVSNPKGIEAQLSVTEKQTLRTLVCLGHLLLNLLWNSWFCLGFEFLNLFLFLLSFFLDNNFFLIIVIVVLYFY